MVQDCSLPSSTAGLSAVSEVKRLPKGIHVIEASHASASGVGDVSSCKALPWGYIRIPYMKVAFFESYLARCSKEGEFCPRCLIHRIVRYKQKRRGKGVKKEKVPSLSGIVFLQGTTRQLRLFLQHNFPQYYLINDCCTRMPACIPDSVMRPFMGIMTDAPERLTFLREPFIKFAQQHVKLCVLTGLFKGQEGYVVRINRDRQLVLDLGSYAVAVSNVHNEDFEVVEQSDSASPLGLIVLIICIYRNNKTQDICVDLRI